MLQLYHDYISITHPVRTLESYAEQDWEDVFEDMASFAEAFTVNLIR